MQPETELRAVWREFKETARDLTHDVGTLPLRVMAQHYRHRREGMAGDQPVGPLKAALHVVGTELMKTAGGWPAAAAGPLSFVAGSIASNLVLNTFFARNFWLDQNRPILPRHAARRVARQAQLGR